MARVLRLADAHFTRANTNHRKLMHIALTVLSSSLALLAAMPKANTSQGQRVIHAGEDVEYDTANGDLILDSLIIEAGGTLHVVGRARFRLIAKQFIQIDGTLDLSGADCPPVFTLNNPAVPVVGADGGPLAGAGGTASFVTTDATPFGLPGFDGVLANPLGGGGGESGFSPIQTDNGAYRRSAGGGGGVFGPRELIVPGDLEDPQNTGRVALSGVDGSPQATGAVSGNLQPKGGGTGSAIFVDALADNDFFGRKPLAGGGALPGELLAPQAGQGGGAAGDALASDLFPPLTFNPVHHDQGGGGGGGGGLAILISRRISVGAEGLLLANGGNGGDGENTSFLNHVGGGGGAGSGGMLVLQAQTLDLSQAAGDVLSALGGTGGHGANHHLRAIGGGGHGGPGLIQLHVPEGNPMHLLLPSNVILQDVSVPDAHLLMLEPSL
ncbi:MAG: hypothetical protein ACI9F9_000449 [Candidatus Paceibacteria bacterium]|jgi:hypothetical protein